MSTFVNMPRRNRRGMRIAFVAVVVLFTSGLIATRVSAAAPATVHVEPTNTLFSQPVHIRATGLPPRKTVTLAVSAVDARGVRWTSSATYRTSAGGGIDVDHSPALLGSYEGVNGMGLIESMTPTRQVAGDIEFVWGLRSTPFAFHVTVRMSGQQLTAATFQREGMAPGVRARVETLSGAGFDGGWWLPPPGTRRHPGVLVFGGDEGGIAGSLISSALASAGYPTLDIAYFQGGDPAAAPGLPKTLHDIPLEYFAKALRWLANRPQVEAQKIYVESGSRGTQAAFLLGVHYPKLVHGIINLSASDVAFGSLPAPGGPVWTFRGKPVPYSRAAVGPSGTPGVNTDALIPVQEIRGPILLACGSNDQLQDSCGYDQDAEQRLSAAHDPFPHPSYTYPNAGHLVDQLIAYEPVSPTALSLPEYQDAEGPTPLANDQADANLWPQVLHFLATT